MIRNHSGKVYHCHICGQKFSLPENMKRHVQTVHMKTKISCQDCGKEFTCKDHLRRHCKSVHEGKRHQCTFCDKNYSQAGDLHRHMKLAHGTLGSNELKMAHAKAMKLAAEEGEAGGEERLDEGIELGDGGGVGSGLETDTLAEDGMGTEEDHPGGGTEGFTGMDAIVRRTIGVTNLPGNSLQDGAATDADQLVSSLIACAVSSASHPFLSDTPKREKLIEGPRGTTTTTNSLREFALHKSSHHNHQSHCQKPLPQPQQSSQQMTPNPPLQLKLLQPQPGLTTQEQLLLKTSQQQQQQQALPPPSQPLTHQVSSQHVRAFFPPEVNFSLIDPFGPPSSGVRVQGNAFGNGVGVAHTNLPSHPPPPQLQRALSGDEVKLLTPSLTSALGASLSTNAFLPSQQSTTMIITSSASSAFPASYLATLPANISTSHVG